MDEDELNALSMYLTRSIFLNRIVVVDLNHTNTNTHSVTHFIYYYLCIDQTLHRSDLRFYLARRLDIHCQLHILAQQSPTTHRSTTTTTRERKNSVPDTIRRLGWGRRLYRTLGTANHSSASDGGIGIANSIVSTPVVVKILIQNHKKITRSRFLLFGTSSMHCTAFYDDDDADADPPPKGCCLF